MGFQQELFEVDLERGISGPPNKRSPRARGDAAISIALLLLVLAAAAPVGAVLSRILTLAALSASAFGTAVLARRRPRAPARRILALLAACWLLYGTRMCVSRAPRHDCARDARILAAWRTRRFRASHVRGVRHGVARPRVLDTFVHDGTLNKLHAHGDRAVPKPRGARADRYVARRPVNGAERAAVAAALEAPNAAQVPLFA